MFYDALKDLGIERTKAKTMYFAVYLFGPHWVNLVPGENCGQNCIKFFGENVQRWEGDRYSSPESQKAIYAMKEKIERNPDIPVSEIERLAEKLEPDNFFFNNGSSYAPSGRDDPNATSSM